MPARPEWGNTRCTNMEARPRPDPREAVGHVPWILVSTVCRSTRQPSPGVCLSVRCSCGRWALPPCRRPRPLWTPPGPPPAGPTRHVASVNTSGGVPRRESGGLTPEPPRPARGCPTLTRPGLPSSGFACLVIYPTGCRNRGRRTQNGPRGRPLTSRPCASRKGGTGACCGSALTPGGAGPRGSLPPHPCPRGPHARGQPTSPDQAHDLASFLLRPGRPRGVTAVGLLVVCNLAHLNSFTFSRKMAGRNAAFKQNLTS